MVQPFDENVPTGALSLGSFEGRGAQWSRAQGAKRPTSCPIAYRLAGVSLALLLSGTAAASDEEGGPRPPRLTDFTSRSALVVGSEFGRMGEASGLALPISARVKISPELVLEVEVPFGYLNAPGEVIEPMVGNLGVGIVGSASDRLGTRGHVRWGLRIGGRAPTAPKVEAGRRAVRVARLRSLTPQASERWSPGAASVRIDVGVSYGTEDLGGQVQLSALAAVPAGQGAATAHGLYGLMLGYRIYQGLWVQAEILGAQVAPGAGDIRAGHYLTATAGLRLAMMRVSPVFFVSIPLQGDVEGDRPVVIGVEVASW